VTAADGGVLGLAVRRFSWSCWVTHALSSEGHRLRGFMPWSSLVIVVLADDPVFVVNRGVDLPGRAGRQAQRF